MARITVDDCLDKVENRFHLVILASRRARQLAMGAEPRVHTSNSKTPVIALKEISSSVITPEEIRSIVIKPPAPVEHPIIIDNQLDE